ncbi:MAG: thioredoxin [Candidatus Sumerlaeia bacterium]|nr:thioredoxin [Candidatus Sumerlaeia bacterium]
MSDEVILTEENFDVEVIQSEIPVLVDFWAAWCGPCLRVAPIISELASELKGKVKVGKVNVDDNLTLSARYGIQSIPTLVLFKDGIEVKRLIGALPKETIKSAIKEACS